MRKYIVFENGFFKAMECMQEPINMVLVEPNKTYSNNTYILVSNGVHISWLDEYKWNGKYKCLTIEYRNVKLLEVNHVKRIQIVVDALNQFRSLDEERLEMLYQTTLERKKSDLETEIEELRDARNKLHNETVKYREVVKKVKEVFLLIENLDKK